MGEADYRSWFAVFVRLGDGPNGHGPHGFKQLPRRRDGCVSMKPSFPRSCASLSSQLVALVLRTPREGIGDPATDVGFVPACTVDTDLYLAWKGAFGDLAIDRGPRQAGPEKDGFQADDPVWFRHGRTASSWLVLIAPDPETTGTCVRARGFSGSSCPSVETAANRTCSDPNAASPADAMAECEFRSEAPAGIGMNAKLALAASEERFELRIAFEALGHVGHGRAG